MNGKEETVKVSLIIPTYNALALLKETLPTLIESLKIIPFPTELVIADNGSKDGTEAYCASLAHNSRYFRNSFNLGFSKACNQGAELAKGEFLFFINNDIKTEGDFLTPLLNLYGSQTNIFAVGPRFLRWDKTTLDDAARNPHYENGLVEAVLDTQNLTSVKPMVFFLGGGFLTKKTLFRELGGFDEIYSPFAWEDLDLGYRAVKRGFINLYCPAVTLYHKREATSKNIFPQWQFKAIVWRNKFIFMWSNFTDTSLLLNHFMLLPMKLVKFLFNGRWPYVLGFFLALTRLRGILRKRKQEKKYSRLTDRAILKIT